MSENKNSQKLKTIVIFSDNIALSSILHSTLAQNPQLRVREFKSESKLVKYMSIASIDLLIYDCEQVDAAVVSTVQHLRSLEEKTSDFQTITLCKTIPKGIRVLCKSVGIDEIIIKPMSPVYLETRVLARVNKQALSQSIASLSNSENRRRNDFKAKQKLFTKKRLSTKENNVINLFGDNNTTKPPTHIN